MAGCELLSICDLTIFDTPGWPWYQYLRRLWIAFNLWFDDLWHTIHWSESWGREVVNCFQFVIWRSLTHRIAYCIAVNQGCELLSICDLTIFDTPRQKNDCRITVLWIAFNLWFDDLWHTIGSTANDGTGVVNCFQFVIWRSLTHLCTLLNFALVCCELLSICDLTIFDTPPCLRRVLDRSLWIAFNLWFDDLWHTKTEGYNIPEKVVNCFQFVIWRSLTHPSKTYLSCKPVVNCFQFVIWRSLTHLTRVKGFWITCCELLSICDLTIFDTPACLWLLFRLQLWIAFNLWFDDLWHT